MSCSEYIPPKAECGNIPNPVKIIRVKNYVYETINGKRKRVSPFVFGPDGVIIEIKQRAIISVL